MNTKMKQIALPFVVVIAVLLAFSSPAAADYSGDHPLTTYEHGFLEDGGLIFETVTDGSGYFLLNAISSGTYSQDITIDIPKGATVKTARLYNYVTWSKPDFGNYAFVGLPAEADLTFNRVTVTCQNPLSTSCTVLNPPVGCRDALPNPIDYGNGVIQYWDTKGQGYTDKLYDCPSGTFAWDVTEMVTGSGTYTAKIANADSSPTTSEYFRTFGFGLLVVYEEDDEGGEGVDKKAKKAKKAKTAYWIAEGCDYLITEAYGKFYETPEDATTSAWFEGRVPMLKDATLTTVLTTSDKGILDPPLNMVYFNSEEIGPSTAKGDKHIGVNDFDVTEELMRKNNIAEFQDRDDCEVVCNAFLVIN